MNYNPGSVDDLLQSAGAKQLKRTMELFHGGSNFLDLSAAPRLRQFPSDQIDNQWARQLARRGELMFAQRIKKLINSRNFPARTRFHSFTRIRRPRGRWAMILPMTAAQGVRLCRKSPSTFSSFAAGTQSSNPPLVCASVRRIRRESSVVPQSTATVVATRFSRLPPGIQACSIKSAISSAIIGTALESTSAETPLARHSETKWPIN